MWSSIYLFVAVFAALSKGVTVQSNKQKKIYGGSPLPISKAPYMAQLKTTNDYVMKCGAVIVRKNFVISAAHCYMPTQKQYILVGSDKYNQGERHDILTVVIHPEYIKYKRAHNDVVVIMLSRPLLFTDNVLPIQMAPRKWSLNSGDMLLTMGFGITESIHKTKVLLAVEVPYVTNKDCIELYKNETRVCVTEQLICAGVQGKNTCLGDSGGPLVYNHLLVGLVTFGYNCSGPLPGLYTRISTFRDFIETTMNKLNNEYGNKLQLLL